MAEEEDVVEPTQSILLCILFSAISGLLRVVATMCLAFPDYLQKKNGASTSTTPDGGDTTTTNKKTLYIAAHLFVLAVAAVLSIVGAIYGPVSIAVPVQTGSCLLFNVVAMGIVLKMRAFNKAQRTGTYVVFFSILSLVDVGPGVQDNQDALVLLSTPMAIGWVLFVTALMLVAAVGTGALLKVRTTTETSLIRDNATLILTIGTCMSNVGMATSSKTFGSLHGGAFVGALFYYLVVTGVGVLFSVVSSTACDQGIFTPLSSVALIVTNMITGIIVWEDWKVMHTWIAYICACLLMCCGVYLLAEVDLLEKYYRKAVADAVLGPQPSTVCTTVTTVEDAGSGEYGTFPDEDNIMAGEVEAVRAREDDSDADVLVWQATLLT